MPSLFTSERNELLTYNPRVPALIVTLIGLGTLAFGAVYPWGFLPLFAAAALVGLAGIRHGRIQREVRPVAVGLVLLVVAVAAQLLPIPRATLDALSPHTAEILAQYSLVFANGAVASAPLSINPRSTQIAILALGALGLYLIGVPALLGDRALRRLPLALAVFAVPLALFGISQPRVQQRSHVLVLALAGRRRWGPIRSLRQPQSLCRVDN